MTKTILRSLPVAVAVTLGLCAAGAAQATVITYSNFNDTLGLTLVGDTTTTGSPQVLRIVPANGGTHGAAYSTTPVTLGTGATFSTRFQFQFTDPGGIDPADGMTFVLAANPSGLGGSGGGMGYKDVPNSFAIEFDTYGNFIDDPSDSSSNHVAIDTNGNLTNTDLTDVYGNGSCGFSAANGGYPAQNPYTAAGCMSNGDIWTALITYDGSTQLLNVSLNDPSEADSFDAISNYSIDIASLLGTDTAYVGFTGGTGAGWENEDVLNWTFANTATLPPTGVPEPGALGLFCAGLAGLGMFLRRCRRR